MAAVVLTFPTEAAIEEIMNTCADRRHTPRTIYDLKLFTNIWIYASKHIIIDTEGEEETGKSRMGRGHNVVTDICYNRSEL